MPIPRSMKDHSAVHIGISLHHGQDVYRPSDRLYGEAILIAQVDTYFEIIKIHLTGISRTHNDYNTSGGVINHTAGAHNFLSISQPNLEQLWPHDNVLKAKHQYTLPFEFTLPSTLLSSACDHRVASASVREAHLQLPPSLNDNDESAMLKVVRKLLPKTVEIRYDILVHVRMAKKSVAVSKPRKIVEMRRKIQVKPSHPRAHRSLQEIHGTAHNYMNLRHGLLRRKCGSVAMNVAPLEALHISTQWPTTSPCVQSPATLHFVPFELAIPPPELVAVRAYLETTTYFATTNRGCFPAACIDRQDPSQGLIRSRFPLPTTVIGGIAWRVDGATNTEAHQVASKHDVPTQGFKKICRAHELPAQSSMFTGTLDIQTTFPPRKIDIPTFHSCLVSRTYEIKFEMVLRTAGILSRLSVKVPLYVIFDGDSDDSLMTTPTREALQRFESDEDAFQFCVWHQGDEGCLPEYSRSEF